MPSSKSFPFRAGATTAAVFALSAAWACSAPASPEASSVEQTATRAQADDTFARTTSSADAGATPPYTFYLVTSLGGWGYTARALGGHYTVCPDRGYGAACPVDTVDMTGLGLATADANAILAQLGPDPSAATLILVGTLDRVWTRWGASTVLHTSEVWRAPAQGTVRASDDWFHVSHGGTQGLLVNRWQPQTIKSLDLSGAPLIPDCDPNPDGGAAVCTLSQSGVVEDASSPAGILVDGALGYDGTLHVRQYLAKIGIGMIHVDNGYWYCRADQVACANSMCEPAQDRCTVQGWHGGGLLPPYIRTVEAPAQPWLVSTTQLTAAESASNAVAAAQH
jgi:hypothetical protein